MKNFHKFKITIIKSKTLMRIETNLFNAIYNLKVDNIIF